jgi:putative IMPACT (imprinted ancient) family translation regulator
MSKINLDTDITFCERIDSDQSAIKITSGKYKDVIYTYGQVSVHENKELETCSLKFNYQIQDPLPENISKDIDKDMEFQNYIGDILMTLIDEKKVNDKLTKDNT